MGLGKGEGIHVRRSFTQGDYVVVYTGNKSAKV